MAKYFQIKLNLKACNWSICQNNNRLQTSYANLSIQRIVDERTI